MSFISYDVHIIVIRSAEGIFNHSDMCVRQNFQTYEVSKVSPEKGGQCCYFQSDWHWAVTLHSTELDSGLVANTGSSVTAAVQNNSAW